MTIKHLIISGGGPMGLRYLGALQHLEKNNIWKLEDIQTIYATSIGTILAIMICLKFDWDTLNEYLVERPWNDSFKVSFRQIWSAYTNKGLFDKKLCEIVLKPLFNAKDIKINITLKEFYELTKIDIHFFSFDINKFETYEISYKTHPDLELVQASTISSSLPGLFIPTLMDGKCLIDGGVKCNYPVDYCIRDNKLDKDNFDEEMLGIKLEYEEGTNNYNDADENSTLLEYTITLTTNAAQHILDLTQNSSIKNTIKCFVSKSPISLDFIKKAIGEKEFRKELINQGIEDAKKYLELL
jgi:hypothetical protein